MAGFRKDDIKGQLEYVNKRLNEEVEETNKLIEEQYELFEKMKEKDRNIHNLLARKIELTKQLGE